MDLPLHDTTSRPLLSSETAEPPFQTEPRTQRGGGRHGKHTEWVVVPFRRILYTILAAIALIVVGFAAFGSVLGIRAYRQLVFPHSKVHASPATAKDGSRAVKPYFAPSARGGVSDVKLVMKVWFREGTPFPPLPSEDGQYQWEKIHLRDNDEEIRRFTGEQGFIVPEEGEQHKWEEVWSGDMGETDLRVSTTIDARVTLPGTVVHSLVTDHRSSLIATFELVPASPDLSSDLTYIHTSTRPMALYGPTQPWPLPRSSSEYAATLPSPLESFLAHSSAGQTLHTRLEYYSGNYDYFDAERDRNYALFLATRTWVTLATDYSTYGLQGFREAMDALQTFKETCANSTYVQHDCYRAFARDGHFENLLHVEGSGPTEYKYGPFITTRLSPLAPKDYVRLPTEETMVALSPDKVQPFTFDWHVTYSALSPAKLSRARSVWELRAWEILSDDSRGAATSDNEEFYGALLGLTFDSNSRPISRKAVGFAAQGLGYLAIPFILHYWATRRVSTGIALLSLTAQSMVDLVCYIVTCAVDIYAISIPVFVVAIICFVLMILKQLYMWLKPEFQLGRFKIPATELMCVYPVAVRLEYASVTEKASYEKDARFDWRLRLLIVLVTFIILRFLPAPPAIVSAHSYSDIMQGFGGAQHFDTAVLSALHILSALQGAAWLVSRLSQILLNHRSQTFGGSYGITAYLLSASLLLSHITKIFVRWFGRSHLMQPFTVWDIVTLLVSATVAIQARMLPQVEQDVNEALD